MRMERSFLPDGHCYLRKTECHATSKCSTSIRDDRGLRQALGVGFKRDEDATGNGLKHQPAYPEMERSVLSGAGMAIQETCN